MAGRCSGNVIGSSWTCWMLSGEQQCVHMAVEASKACRCFMFLDSQQRHEAQCCIGLGRSCLSTPVQGQEQTRHEAAVQLCVVASASSCNAPLLSCWSVPSSHLDCMTQVLARPIATVTYTNPDRQRRPSSSSLQASSCSQASQPTLEHKARPAIASSLASKAG